MSDNYLFNLSIVCKEDYSFSSVSWRNSSACSKFSWIFLILFSRDWLTAKSEAAASLSCCNDKVSSFHKELASISFYLFWLSMASKDVSWLLRWLLATESLLISVSISVFSCWYFNSRSLSCLSLSWCESNWLFSSWFKLQFSWVRSEIVLI